MSNPDSPLCPWASSQPLELREMLLDPSEAARLRDHLAGCPHCRQELAWEERLTRQLRAAPPVPSNVAARVRRRLSRRRVQWVVGTAAAVLLAVGLAWSLWPRLPDRSGPERVETPPLASADVPGSNVLFAAPPVDGLDVLARQQSAYLAALGQPEEKAP